MKRVAYLVMGDEGDFVTDYHLSFEPMRALGWEVRTVDWRHPDPRWDEFDAVYIAAPWDYPESAQEFLRVLDAIDASRAVLVNDAKTVRWNMNKSTYLRDVALRGHDVVPTTHCDDFSDDKLEDWFEAHDTRRLVLKPAIGANAVDTFVVSKPDYDTAVSKEQRELLRAAFKGGRAFLVQPFIHSICDRGEFSLFFFDGVYSHAISKVPKSGDFRVQEEHGGAITAVEPPQELRKVAAAVFGDLDPVPVYGRGDWVCGPGGRYLLMELELIEPSLYLRTDPGAAARFAAAFDRRFLRLPPPRDFVVEKRDTAVVVGRRNQLHSRCLPLIALRHDLFVHKMEEESLDGN